MKTAFLPFNAFVSATIRALPYIVFLTATKEAFTLHLTKLIPKLFEMFSTKLAFLNPLQCSWLCLVFLPQMNQFQPRIKNFHFHIFRKLVFKVQKFLSLLCPLLRSFFFCKTLCFWKVFGFVCTWKVFGNTKRTRLCIYFLFSQHSIFKLQN